MLDTELSSSSTAALHALLFSLKIQQERERRRYSKSSKRDKERYSKSSKREKCAKTMVSRVLGNVRSLARHVRTLVFEGLGAEEVGTERGIVYYRRAEKDVDGKDVEKRWMRSETTAALYTPQSVSAAWMAWLNYRRADPPTVEELAMSERRRKAAVDGARAIEDTRLQRHMRRREVEGEESHYESESEQQRRQYQEYHEERQEEEAAYGDAADEAARRYVRVGMVDTSESSGTASTASTITNGSKLRDETEETRREAADGAIKHSTTGSSWAPQGWRPGS